MKVKESKNTKGIDKVIDINTGEEFNPNSNTTIYTDSSGKPVDLTGFSYKDDSGDYHSVTPLQEVTVTPKRGLLDFINDDILLNKNNVRVNNMRRLLSTDYGKKIQESFAEGGRDASLLLTAPYWLPSSTATAIQYPASTLLGIGGSELGRNLINNLTRRFTGNSWGKNVSNLWNENMPTKAKMSEEIGEMTNPGMWLGGIYGVGKGKLVEKNASKFVNGDLDMAWNKLDKDHWLLKGGNYSEIPYAALNRLLPFLNNVEKTPLRLAAYQVGKRTKGSAHVTLKDIIKNESSYTGSATPDGNDRNLLGFYLFKNDPIINKTKWFKNIESQFPKDKWVGFKFDKRYSELYPGVEQRRYTMNTLVPNRRPITFNSEEELAEYAPVGKTVGKESSIIVETPEGLQAMETPTSNMAGPIDDVGGHLVKMDYRLGRLYHISQDMWKFNPQDYSIRYPGSNKQPAIMDKLGTPFILQSMNPVKIGHRLILDNRPLGERFIKRKQGGTIKAQEGIKFVQYTPLEDSSESMDYDMITPENIEDTFGQYSYMNMMMRAMENKSKTNADTVKEEPVKKEEYKAPSLTRNFYSKSKEDFVSTLRPIFKEALKNNGLDTKWTNYLLAHAAIESAWGKSNLSSQYNNFAGIKGKGANFNTKEYENGEHKTINASFRSFDSVEDFADSWIKMLKDRFNAFKDNNYLKNIRDKGYFTEPLENYSTTFNSILKDLSSPKYVLSKLNVKITSAYRPGSKTKQGNASYHSMQDENGNSMAYDIVPLDGDFDRLRRQMISDPEIRELFASKGLGVIDETSDEMMKRTGATGRHFHIGPDKVAIQTWKKWNG